MDGNIASNGQFVPNGSAGNFNAGSRPVILSGEGDIILTPSTPKKSNGKRWLAVVVIVLFLIAIVTGIAAVIVRGGRNEKTNSATEFHALLEENEDAIKNIISVVKYVYSSSISLTGFIPTTQEDTEFGIAMMWEGIAAMEKLQKRMNSGSGLFGVKNEIDLSENYAGLKNALANDIEKYRSFVELTTKLLQITQETNIQEEFADYGAALTLANEIQMYQISMARLTSVAPLNGKCTSADMTICESTMAEIMSLQDGAYMANPTISQAYKNSIGEFNYENEGSLMYYFNNLYAGTEEYETD